MPQSMQAVFTLTRLLPTVKNIVQPKKTVPDGSAMQLPGVEFLNPGLGALNVILAAIGLILPNCHLLARVLA